MSTTIDERVVSMQFDNKQFETNVQTSLGTLDKLKQSLNLTGASKGLENVSSAAKRFDLSGIGNAVENVKYRFSALEVMAVTALANITNSAVNAGKRLVSAFTIDPIKSGLEEYETQINSVQTILANTESKGTTLDDVNNALDTLNKYADKTIYNFTQMTRNIGTFTAAGVDLDTSVNAIQGIANLAAISGSNSQQASTAMYQLSQALASGTVKLMDWNSVVNAGMGGQVFQDALKETARVHGIKIDEMIKKQGSFRETLQEGWLTSEVLTETLQKFTLTTEGLTEEQIKANREMLKSKGYNDEQIDAIFKLGETATDAATKVKTFTQLMDTLKEAAQSGWTQTWELIIGDFGQAKELWTSVSDVFGELINKSADSRNKLLEGAMTSNWDKLIKKINEAGVETSDFEEKLKTIAKDNGYDIDKLVEKYGSLEKAFKSGAISSDILKKAIDGIKKTSDGLKGKGNILESVTGTFKVGQTSEDVKKIEEALKSLGYTLTGKDGIDYSGDGYYGTLTRDAVKAFQKANGLKITGIVDEETLNSLKKATSEIGNMSDAAADTTEDMYDLVNGVTELGGRELLLQSFKNIFKGILSVVRPIKAAFRNIFPPMTSEQLYKLIAGFEEITSKFKLSHDQMLKLSRTFKGIFSVLKIGRDAIFAVGGAIGKLVSNNLPGFIDGVLSVTAGIGDWLTNLGKATDKTNIFGNVIDKIVGFLQGAIDKIKDFGSFIKDIFSFGNEDSEDNPVEKIIGDSDKLAKKVEFLEKLKSTIGNIWNSVKGFGEKIVEIGAELGKALVDVFRGGDINNLLKVINGGLLASLLIGIKKFFKQFTGSAEEGFGLFESLKGVFGNISGVLDSVKNSLTAWQQSLKADVLMKIAKAIAILAASIVVVSMIDPDKLSASLGAITMLFADLIGSLAIFDKMGGKFSGAAKSIGVMQGLAVSVLILAFALKTVSDLDSKQLVTGIVGIFLLMGMVIQSAKAMSSIKGKAMKGASGLILFAVAIKVLASAVKDLSTLSWDELAKGLSGVGVLIGEISAFLNNTKLSGKAIPTAIGIVVLAGALKLLTYVCKDFAQMSVKQLVKGLGAIGIVLAELAVFANLSGNAKHIISTGIALVLIGSAMKIFASAVADFSKMKWDEIGRGLAAMAGALISVAVATRLMPSNMIGTGIGLIVVAGALVILATALDKMKGSSWDEIGRGLATLGGSIAILAIGLNFMTGTLSGSFALIVAAGALAILTPCLKALGSMSWTSIAKGLIAIAGAFAVIGVAALVLGPIVPAIIALAGAVALIGVAALAFGLGVAAIAAGLTALVAVTAGGATAIVAALTIIITGIINLIPSVIAAIGQGIVEFCRVIGESATAIGEAITAVILATVQLLVESVPEIANGAMQIITGVLNALVEYTPQIIESLFNFIIAVLDGFAAKLPELIQSVVNVFMSFFSGVVEALKGVDVSTLINGIVGIGIMSGIMVALGAVAALVPAAMAGVLGMGGVIAEMALVLAAIGAFAQIPGLEWLIGEGAGLLQSIGNAIGGFIGGIIGGIGEGITDSLPTIATNLSTFMTNLQPFIDGAKLIDASMLDGVNTIVSIITSLTGASLLESITSFITGSSSMDTFTTQLTTFGDGLKSFADSVTGINIEAVNLAATAAGKLTEMAGSIPNEGGLLSLFAGENSLGSFATQLPLFGQGMKSFADSVAGIDTVSVTAAATAAESLASMAALIPNEGGLLGLFAGENSIGSFGTQLPLFGEGLKGFADNVAGIDGASVTAASTAAKDLAEMANLIPNQGGLFSLFTGDNSMETFGNELEKFGKGMAKFSKSVADINIEAVGAATTVASRMTLLANRIPEGGYTTLEDFGSQLSDFGSDISDFSTNLGDTSSLTTAASNVSTLVTELITACSTDLSKLKTFSTSLEELGKGGVDGFVKALRDGKSKASKASNEMFASVLESASKSKDAFIKIVKEMGSKAVSAIREKYGDFKSAGEYVAKGLAKGIADKRWMSEDQAERLARAAIEAAKRELGEHSPSKVFYKIGDFAGLGFINGLDRYASKAYNSSAEVADSARKGMSGAVSKISDLIQNGIDTQPTIRPVVDLSGVASGANAINGMFRMSPSLSANVGSISAMMNRNQNRVSNADVVSAIKDLGKKIGRMSGDTYSVNGVTYDDGSNVSNAVRDLTRAIKMERRV